MTISKDIEADYGATGDGVTDDSAAFLAAQVAGIAAGNEPFVLNLPNGGDYNNASAGAFVQGIKNLTLNMQGARVAEFTITGPFFQVPGKSSRLSLAQIGSKVITLATAAETSFYSIGDPVCVADDEMQGTAGYPPNFVNFEYGRIESIGVGTLTLEVRLTRSYRTTLPATSSGDYDTGGPATVFKLKPGWDQRLVINATGGVIDATEAVQICGRQVYVNGGTIKGDFAGGASFAPSCSDDMILTGVTFANNVENDKNITSLRFIDCVCPSGKFFKTQSQSISNLDIRGGSYSKINGTTPTRMSLSGATVGELFLGGLGYGNNRSFLASACTISAISPLTLGNWLDLTGDLDNYVEYVGGGIFRAAKADGVQHMWYFAVPGVWAFFSGTGGGSPTNWGHSFRVLDVYEDGAYVYFRTTLTLSVLPSYSGTSGLELTQIRSHAGQVVSFSNTSGCAAADSLSFAAAAGLPFASYSKEEYSGNIGTGQDTLPLWGHLQYIKVNVTKAFTGTGALALKLFATPGMILFSSSNVYSRYDPSIDLRTAGERIITAGLVTGGGGDDSITPFVSGDWSAQAISAYVGTDISGQDPSTHPIVTIEALTDQDIVAATEDSTEANDGLAFHSDHAPVKYYAKLNKVEHLVRRVAPESLPEPTILPRDFYDKPKKMKRRFTIADGFSDA